MEERLLDSGTLSLPYQLKQSKAQFLSSLMPGIPCCALILWSISERIWAGAFFFLPFVFAFGFFAIVDASRSIILQKDSLQITGIFLKPQEFFYPDIEGIDIVTNGKTSRLILQSHSSSAPLKISLTPFGLQEWRKLIQILIVNVPNIVIGTGAARLLKGALYY